MIEYIEISGIKTIVRLPDNYLCGRKYKVIFINDGEIVNNIEQPDNQIYVGLIPKNRLAAKPGYQNEPQTENMVENVSSKYRLYIAARPPSEYPPYAIDSAYTL